MYWSTIAFNFKVYFTSHFTFLKCQIIDGDKSYRFLFIAELVQKIFPYGTNKK